MKAPFDQVASLAWSQFWQVTVLVLVVAVVVRLFCRRRPHLAYILWLLVIVKCLTPPIWSSRAGVFSWATARATTSPAPEAVENIAVRTPPPEEVPVIDEAPPRLELTPAAASTESFAQPESSFQALKRPVRAATVLGMIWLGGSLGYVATAIGTRLRWSWLLRDSSVAADGALVSLVADLSKRLGVRRKVRLRVTSRPLGPLACGVFRPTLLLPELLWSEKSPRRVEAVLAHELIHVRRADNAVGILQLASQAIWWFHPLVWWANREACRERERCCDEEAVARLGCEPGEYAQGLLDVLKLKQKLRPVFAFPGVRPGEITSKRMEEIMEPARRFHPRTPRWCWALTLAAAALILPGAELVITQATEPQGNADKPTGEAARAKNDENASAAAASGLIVDPESGLELRRVVSVTNEPTSLKYHAALSPNGKFLLTHHYVVPIDGRAPFKLGDFLAYWGSWSPDGRRIAFRSEGEGTWVVTVSPETARPTGPPQKLIENTSSVAWSPDGEAFAYRSKEGHLWIYSFRDNSKVQITDEFVHPWSSWSPDGKWFAARKADNYIYLISVDGHTSRKLVKGERRMHLHWAPDGQWVFYYPQEEQHKLRFVRVADSLRVDVDLPKDVRSSYLCWPSKGGKMLVYQAAHEWFLSLKLVPALGGELRDPLKEHRHSGVQQRWSADSKYVATYDWERFWILPVSGEKPYPLELNVQVEGKLLPESISPDGNKLMFLAKAEGKQEHYVVPISIERGKTTGAAVKVFDKNIAWDSWNPRIQWSPDSSRLALFCDEDLWIASADGSAPLQLTENPNSESGVEWAADAKRITWTSYSLATKTATRYVCELPEGEPMKLTDDIAPSDAFRRQRSSDGKTAVYALKEGEKIGLWVVAPPQGERKKLLELEEDRRRQWTYALSPDGKALAVVLDNSVSIFSLPDGQQRTIPDSPDLSWGQYPSLYWSPDSQALAVRIWPKPGKDEDHDRLFSVSVRQGKWTELAPNDTGQKYLLDWSPDGKWIAYSSDSTRQTRPEGIIWEVEIDKLLKNAVEKATGDSGPPKK